MGSRSVSAAWRRPIESRPQTRRDSPRLMNVIVVIAAYNEERVIGSVVAGLAQAGWPAVVVDDGSTDGTEAAARASGATVLRHVINRGQGAALQTGIEYAIGAGAEIIVTFDADGQHDVADIPKLVG